MPTVQLPGLGALPPMYQTKPKPAPLPAPAPAVRGLNAAIGGPRAPAPNHYGQPPAGGAGGPGDPAIWQQDPLGQRYKYDAGKPGGPNWIPVGGTTASEEGERYARDLRDEE